MKEPRPQMVGREVRVPETRAEATAYIGQMAMELQKIADRHRLDVLSYILSMAALEADMTGVR